MKTRTLIDDKPLQEKCGIIGLFTPAYQGQLPTALVAASGVQHRGQQGAGSAAQTKKGIVKYTGNGLLADIFYEKIIKRLNKPSTWTLIHCRYGTFGGWSPDNLQPCIGRASDGSEIAVIHNGEFVATAQMKKLLHEKDLPQDISDSYLFTLLLAQAEGDSWDAKILSTLGKVKGAYSLIMGVEEKMYVARDPHGIRPLVLGKIDGGYLAASETFALNKVGAKFVREVRKGEVIRIDKDGLHVIKEGTKGVGNFCDFEWAYFERPDSLLPTYSKDKKDAWMSVTEFRERCGAMLAQEAPIPNASFVVGMQDSGVAVALGYSNALKIPYRQVVIRHHFDLHGQQRLFMRDDELNMIGKRVLGKLSLVRDPRIWKDAIVVVGDDSIVRGNVTANITRAIFSAGAREVHWIIGFPPVIAPCHLGVSMRSGEELIAYKHKGDTREIAREIGATSINYISHKSFVKARILSDKILTPKDQRDIFLANGGCGGCVTGKYPVNKDGTTHPRDVDIRSNRPTKSVY